MTPPHAADPVLYPSAPASGPPAPPTAAPAVGCAWGLRAIPLRWRVSILVALMAAVVLGLGSVLWWVGRELAGELRHLREVYGDQRRFESLSGDIVRLQILVHRSLNAPSPDLLAEIEDQRQALLLRLEHTNLTNAAAAAELVNLTKVTRRFFSDFDALRTLNEDLNGIYRNSILSKASEVSGLYSILDSETRGLNNLLWPSLSKSHSSFSEALILVHGYYLGRDRHDVISAQRNLERVVHALPVMSALATTELQRAALSALDVRVGEVLSGLKLLENGVERQNTLLLAGIDVTQNETSNILKRLSRLVSQLETQAQQQLDASLARSIQGAILLALLFVGLSFAISVLIARSIRGPLAQLHTVMAAFAAGHAEVPIADTEAPDEIGAMARTLKLFSEATVAKQRIERERQDHERRWKLLLQTSPVGIAIISAQHLTLLYANPKYDELFRINDGDAAPARPLAESFANPEDCRSLTETSQREGGVTGFEALRLRADGSSWWCLHEARYLEFEDCPAFVVWHYDLTAHRESEQELRAARDRAECALTDLRTAQESLIQAEKLASLGGLVAGVAHEINTPLGITLTSASLLAEETRILAGLMGGGAIRKSDLQRYLQLAGESSDLMLTNIRRAADLIKSFKQVAVDQASDERRVFNLQEYLEEVLMSLRPQLRRTALSVALECPSDLMLDTWPGPLAQVVTNFIMNSMTHGYEPGTPGCLRLIVTTPAPNEVQLVYADDGKGIAPEVLPHIFDPFFTTNRAGGGTGLGLNIVYNIVQQKLRGRISVDSTPGGGARFTIVFPQQS